VGDPIIDYETGDIIDPETGEVVGRVMVHGIAASARHGAEPSLRHYSATMIHATHDSGLHTYIYGDSKLRRLNEKVRGGGPLTRALCDLWKAAADISNSYAVKARLVNSAAQLYKLLGFTHPKTHVLASALTACLYVAAREMGIPITIKRVAEAVSNRLSVPAINMSLAWRYTKKLCLEHNRCPKPSTPESMIPWICSELGLGSDVELLAIRIARALPIKARRGSAAAVAAGCIYIAARLLNHIEVTIQSLANVIGSSSATISKHMNTVLESVDIDAWIATA